MTREKTQQQRRNTADGNYIDWTKPPYCRNGIIDYRPPGETYLSHEVIDKRRSEYLRTMKRNLPRGKRT